MPFETLPNKITSLPEIYHRTQISPPPVYDTEKLIRPLMALADYMSPHKRALRQMQVAQANAEYRNLMPGGREDQMWYMKLRQLKLEEQRTNLSQQRSDRLFQRQVHNWGIEDEDRKDLEGRRKANKERKARAQQLFGE